MNTEKVLYEVEVAGLLLKLRSSHDQDVVDELISLVNNKIDDAQSRNPSISFQNALLLASLHIAEDYVQLKTKAMSQLEGIENRAQQLVSDLESSPISQIRYDN